MMGVGRNRCRLLGDYIVEEKIGSGTFADVWRGRHRSRGHEVAIKEIDRRKLESRKVFESLHKERKILATIHHRNIINFYDYFETREEIFLVLEYCAGGDLSAYLKRQPFGRVSEAVARHFMQHMAWGLQVLRENNIIHRDLKPQNLLLSSKDEMPDLKIGDFGFARHITPQNLAETICGSPLYMAPEIMSFQKYDMKADLWSVGAILYQLVTGKPPFGGSNHPELHQNILKSKELQFPRDVVKQLHVDCIDLCRSLLRQNPVERPAFEEFISHKFIAEPRPVFGISYFPLLPENTYNTPAEFGKVFANEKSPLTYDKDDASHPETSLQKFKDLPFCGPSCEKSVKESLSDHGREESTSGPADDVNKFRLHTADESAMKSVNCDLSKSSDQDCVTVGAVNRVLLDGMNDSKAVDSMELIERDYVFVKSHFASMDTLCFSCEASGQVTPEFALSNKPAETDKCLVDQNKPGESLPSTSVEYSRNHCSKVFRTLHQFISTLSALAQQKHEAELFLESFSIELVCLAVWKKALHASESWIATSTEQTLGKSLADELQPVHDYTNSSLSSVDGVDFDSPTSVYSWAKQGLIGAFDRAEKISSYLLEMDGDTEMPDSMEVIFRTALEAGKRGAVEEFYNRMVMAAAEYSKATILLSFLLQGSTSLRLNPSFSLSTSDQQRIQRYIAELKAHLRHIETQDS